MTQTTTAAPPGAHRAGAALAIEVRGLHVRFEDFEAVRGIDVDVGVLLPDLRAAPASLADIYHAVRIEQTEVAGR